MDIGGFLFATVLATFAALVAAAVGFVGGIFLCGLLFSGEATESGLVVAPLARRGFWRHGIHSHVQETQALNLAAEAGDACVTSTA
jgi:hypothetical protein